MYMHMCMYFSQLQTSHKACGMLVNKRDTDWPYARTYACSHAHITKVHAKQAHTNMCTAHAHIRYTHTQAHSTCTRIAHTHTHTHRHKHSTCARKVQTHALFHTHTHTHTCAVASKITSNLGFQLHFLVLECRASRHKVAYLSIGLKNVL